MARSTRAVTTGLVGSPLWSTVVCGQIDCSGTLVAPSSRAESGGVTVWSCTVHSDHHTGGVGTGVSNSDRRRLPGASCSHANGQAPGTATAPTPAIDAPWWGDPSVTTRRALVVPS